MTLLGKIENHKIVLDDPVELPEGTRVSVELQPFSEGSQIPTLYDRYKSIIGIGVDMPSDMAENHDHYAHGAPEPVASESESEIPSFYDRLESVIGTAEGLPADFADKHDRYIHGTAKGIVC